jgi:predicted RNA-binding Zn-ribbon protein involved in translation (DUF1610 family)
MTGGDAKLDSSALAALADLRRKQRLTATFTFSFVAIVVAMAIASMRGLSVELGRISAPLIAAVVVTWAGAMIFMLRSFGSTCPRCGEKFFVKTKFPRWHNNLAQQCMNCGLPLNASGTADVPAGAAAQS